MIRGPLFKTATSGYAWRSYLGHIRTPSLSSVPLVYQDDIPYSTREIRVCSYFSPLFWYIFRYSAPYSEK